MSSTTTTTTNNTGTVILGAGIIGVSTAYYLSLSSPQSSSSSEIHLIDPSPTLFWSASGFAGGFLARNWFAPEVSSLGALSFAEHARLASAHDGRRNWSYAPSTSLGYSAVAADKGVKKRGDDWLRSGTSRAEAAPGDQKQKVPVLSVEDLNQKTPAWLRRREGDDVEVIGGEGDAAQLEPERLCRFLLEEAEGRGVKVSKGTEAVEVLRDGEGVVSGVVVRDVKTGEEREVQCSRIIITAGCWSGQVWEKLFGATSETVKRLPVTSLAGYSLVVKSPRWAGAVDGEGCHAVYTSHAFCPEIFSRVGGQIYFAGLNSAAMPLPNVAEGSKVPTEPMQLVKQAARELLGSGKDGEDDLEVVREGLCFRPVTPWGLPIVARVPDEHLGGGIRTSPGAEGGVFLATGHGPWGISMSLGTGIVMSELESRSCRCCSTVLQAVMNSFEDSRRAAGFSRRLLSGR
ncbi:FAD dependent oxidoreductase [Neurospora tetraspora]|uniref:FAD dependent oxidoreductase n=1 Tax=Neurospora tetraspora TaxID=94610 RepID=A0AAE0MX15_9PEZI|nr:FAD dependent oxidoreductase [Neurospora tetraspora]